MRGSSNMLRDGAIVSLVAVASATPAIIVPTQKAATSLMPSKAASTTPSRAGHSASLYTAMPSGMAPGSGMPVIGIPKFSANQTETESQTDNVIDYLQKQGHLNWRKVGSGHYVEIQPAAWSRAFLGVTHKAPKSTGTPKPKHNKPVNHQPIHGDKQGGRKKSTNKEDREDDEEHLHKRPHHRNKAHPTTSSMSTQSSKHKMPVKSAKSSIKPLKATSTRPAFSKSTGTDIHGHDSNLPPPGADGELLGKKYKVLMCHSAGTLAAPDQIASSTPEACENLLAKTTTSKNGTYPLKFYQAPQAKSGKKGGKEPMIRFFSQQIKEIPPMAIKPVCGAAMAKLATLCDPAKGQTRGGIMSIEGFVKFGMAPTELKVKMGK